MRTIYTCPIPSTWCPACGKVLREANGLGIEYRRKKVWQFPRERRREVIDLSGQDRVPIIADNDGFVLHESGDIVKYLRTKYGE